MDCSNMYGRNIPLGINGLNTSGDMRPYEIVLHQIHIQQALVNFFVRP